MSRFLRIFIIFGGFLGPNTLFATCPLYLTDYGIFDKISHPQTNSYLKELRVVSEYVDDYRKLEPHMLERLSGYFAEAAEKPGATTFATSQEYEYLKHVGLERTRGSEGEVFYVLRGPALQHAIEALEEGTLRATVFDTLHVKKIVLHFAKGAELKIIATSNGGLRTETTVYPYRGNPSRQTAAASLSVTQSSNERALVNLAVSIAEEKVALAKFQKLTNITDLNDVLITAWPEDYATEILKNLGYVFDYKAWKQDFWVENKSAARDNEAAAMKKYEAEKTIAGLKWLQANRKVLVERGARACNPLYALYKKGVYAKNLIDHMFEDGECFDHNEVTFSNLFWELDELTRHLTEKEGLHYNGSTWIPNPRAKKTR